MAADTGRDLRISLPKPFPVNACQVFLNLVDPERRVETFHHACIAVAFAAEGGDLDPFWRPKIASGYRFRFCLAALCRISAVTVVAGEPLCFMNVVIEPFRRLAQRPVEFRVAIHAGVLFLLRHSASCKQCHRYEDPHDRQA